MKSNKRTIMIVQRDPRAQTQRNIRNLKSLFATVQNITRLACGKGYAPVYDWSRGNSSDPLNQRYGGR